jgi:hypothetical protein
VSTVTRRAVEPLPCGGQRAHELEEAGDDALAERVAAFGVIGFVAAEVDGAQPAHLLLGRSRPQPRRVVDGRHGDPRGAGQQPRPGVGQPP